MNAINQTYTELVTTGSTMINGAVKVTMDTHEVAGSAANDGAAKPFAGLINRLASYLATSKFGHTVIRVITIIDLVFLSVDLWGL